MISQILVQQVKRGDELEEKEQLMLQSMIDFSKQVQQRCDEHSQAQKEQDERLNELREQVTEESSKTSILFAEVMDRFKVLEAKLQRAQEEAQAKIEEVKTQVIDEIQESKEEIKEVVLTIFRKEAQRQSVKAAVEDPAKSLDKS